MIRMYCFCGYGVWMHFRLEHGSYLPHFSAGRNQTTAITDCPGCRAALNLMIAHLASNDARYVS